MNAKKLRGLLIFWCLFIGIGAVGGAIGMFVDTTGKAMGMDALLPAFQVLPFAPVLFQSFLFPGISLLIVNGLTQLVTAVFLFRKHRFGAPFGLACGVILMLWICIQFCIFPLNFMSTLYFIFGALEAATGIALIRKERS